MACSDREGRNGHALEDEIEVVRKEIPVLERAGFALVGVAHDVAGLLWRLRACRPLRAGGEPGASSTTQAAAGKLGERVVSATVRSCRDGVSRRDGRREQEVPPPDVGAHGKELTRPGCDRSPRANEGHYVTEASAVEAPDGVPVDEQCGTLIAESGAACRAHRKPAVARGFIALEPERRAHALEESDTPPHPIGHPVAEEDAVFAARLVGEECIESHHALDVTAGQTEPGRELGDGSFRDVAVCLGDVVEDLDEPLWIVPMTCNDRGKVFGHGPGREGTHRSSGVPHWRRERAGRIDSLSIIRRDLRPRQCRAIGHGKPVTAPARRLRRGRR